MRTGSSSSVSVAGPGLNHNRGEIPAGDREALLNGSGHDHFLLLAGDAVVLAVNPKPSGAVVDFESPDAHYIERIHNSSRDRDLSIVKAGGIAINGFDALALMAGSKQQGSHHTGDCGNPHG